MSIFCGLFIELLAAHIAMNPLPTNGAYVRHEIFSFMMSYLAVSLGDRFCMSRTGWTGGGGWVHLKGANNMGMSGLGCESLCLELGSPLLLF